MPKFSIIVPIYNVENYLAQCLASIRKQTFDDIEVLCVIDGSQDRSELIAEQFAMADDRFHVIYKENGGLSSARNFGINHANGDILIFVDSDDEIEPQTCEVLAHSFSIDDPEVVTYGGSINPPFFSDSWTENILTTNDSFYEKFDVDVLFKEHSHPFAWRTALKRDFLERTGIQFDESVPFGEDQIFHFAIYPRAVRIKFISDKLYKYRVRRSGSLMATRMASRGTKLHEHINIADKICADWNGSGYLEQYKNELFSWITEFLVYDCIHIDEANSLELLAEIRQLFRTWFDEDTIPSCFDHKANECASMLLRGSALSAVREHYLLGEKPRSRFIPSLKKQKETKASTLSPQEIEMRAEWFAQDAASCSRELELLSLELKSKN